LAAVSLCIECARNAPRASCTNIKCVLTIALANTVWGVHIVSASKHVNGSRCKLSILLFHQSQTLTEMAEHQLKSLLGLNIMVGGCILCKAFRLKWYVCAQLLKSTPDDDETSLQNCLYTTSFAKQLLQSYLTTQYCRLMRSSAYWHDIAIWIVNDSMMQQGVFGVC